MASLSAFCPYGTSLGVGRWVFVSVCHNEVNKMFSPQLSRSFSKYIDGSLALQYRIELLLAGMEDCGTSNQPVSEKRNLLRSIENLDLEEPLVIHPAS